MLVSVEELRAYMGGYSAAPDDPDVVEAESQLMAAMLQRTQKAVETAINRPVERVQVRELVRSDSKGFLYLRATPVWKLISCGGTTVPNVLETVPTYTVVPDVDLPEDGRILDYAPMSTYQNSYYMAPGRLWVGVANSWYDIQYIGGLDGTNIDDIKQIIIAVTARTWSMNNVGAAGNDMGNVDQINVGDNRVPYLADDERKALQRYRRRVIM